MIVWRCPVPAKVFHAFEVGKRRQRGVRFVSMCGQAELGAIRKKCREPEVLERCPVCATQRERLK